MLPLAPPRARPDTDGGLRPDLVAVGAVVVVVVAAALAGWDLVHAGVDIFLGFPPLLATWDPHVGPGTVPALVTALLVVMYGPQFAERARWGRLLGAAYAAAFVWTMSLALVDGWQRGVADRLTSRDEYLYDVPRVGSVLEMLRTFSDHILTDQAVFWTTHVGAHPPGVFLIFVVLDEIGLGGGGPAALLVVLIGSSAAAAVAVTLRALGAEDVARRVLPFGVLLPGAVWVGVSADGMFAGVLAWGVALLAVAATGRERGHRRGVVAASALAGGVLLGYTLYLSYGLALAGLLPVAVVAVTRAWHAGGLAVAGALVVVAAFTAAGFWWFTGFADVRVIYALSIAQTRPYSYFVWANLAAVAFAAGPAVVAGLRRLRPRALPTAVTLLALAAVAAILLADLSGMSKAEVERIWLPFVVWLVLPCALLPRSQTRGWLIAQAVLALAVNHLLITVW